MSVKNIKNKLIAVLAVLFCALLAFGAALMIPKNEKSASATAASTTLTKDIVDRATHAVNRSGLKDLFAALTGNGNTYSDVEKLFESQSAYTAAGLITKYGKEYNVLFDGKKWIPAYLSRTGGTTGDIILTLWLADSMTVSDKPTESYERAIWAMHSVASTNYSVPYPSSMYSTSYIRAFINGTQDGDGQPIQYSTKYSDDGGLKTISSDEYSSTWVSFISAYSNYLVAPKGVKWQETESAKALGVANVCCLNEAYGMPDEITWQDSYAEAILKGESTYINYNVYTSWKADKLWLPSLTEAVQGGLWDLNETQRRHRESTGLRTGGASNAYVVYRLTQTGERSYYEDKTGATKAQDYGVRPAFHLNLTELNNNLPVPTDVENVYNGEDQKLSSLTTHEWYTDYSTLYDNKDKIEVTYPDGGVLNASTGEGYSVTVTIKDSTYHWIDWRTNSNPSRTFKFKIKKKELKVQFTGAGEVISGGYSATSGDFENYPTVECLASDVCPNDRTEGQGNYATNYPHLRLKYQSSSGSSYAPPTDIGTYTVTAEIDPDKVTNINYEITTDATHPDHVTLTVEHVKVTKPTFKSTDFTYNGSAQTVEIPSLSTINAKKTVVVYTVKKEGGTPSEVKSDSSFEVTDAGK